MTTKLPPAHWPYHDPALVQQLIDASLGFYFTMRREGWEEGPTEGDCYSAVNDALANLGFDPCTDAAKARFREVWCRAFEHADGRVDTWTGDRQSGELDTPKDRVSRTRSRDRGRGGKPAQVPGEARGRPDV